MNEPAILEYEDEYFPSLAALRTAHESFLGKRQELGEMPASLEEIRVFLSKGRETGRLLHDPDERWAAQSILDYWANVIYKNVQEELNSGLQDYDPELAPDIDPARCPYIGLDAFHEEQHDYYYGRQPLVNTLIDRIKTNRMLAIVGESGSGKSSLVLAGLLPELKVGKADGSQDWRYYRLVPGSEPLRSLAWIIPHPDEVAADWIEEQIQLMRKDLHHLLNQLNQDGNQPVVIVVDQFEEVFTLCNDKKDQQAFVDNLLELVKAEEQRHCLILTMRTEFESKIVTVQNLQPYFEQALVRVTPMNASELRQAIEKPAEMVGLVFDKGLVDKLIDDVLGEPAALPLLQFTLFKLWQHKDKNRVTWGVYNHLGGGRKALENSAEKFYNSLSLQLQNTLRLILLQLVRIDERLEVFSKRVPRKSLFETVTVASPWIEEVLQKLAEEKLIRVTQGPTSQEDQIEVTHEALIRNWQRFVTWIEVERARLRQRQQLTEAAERWFETRQDKSYLWRGVLLEEAQKYENLSEREKEFIRVSLMEEQAGIRRLRRLAIGLAVALVIAILFAITTFRLADQAQDSANANKSLAETNAAVAVEKGQLAARNALLAETSRANERTAQAASTEAHAQGAAAEIARQTAEAASTQEYLLRKAAEYFRDVAFSRQLAAQATGFLDTQTDLAALLGIEAFRVADTLEARSVLLNRVQRAAEFTVEEVGRPIPYQASDITSVALSPDGRHLAWSDFKSSIAIWNYPAQKLERRFLGNDTVMESFVYLEFSPDGKWLASGSDNSRITLWDVVNGQPTPLRGVVNSVQSLSFSPTGDRLAAAVGTQVRVWDLTNLGNPQAFNKQNALVDAVAWSPDGKKIASGGADQRVVIWDPETGEVLGSHHLHSGTVLDVAWAPDSNLLASASKDGTILIYDYSKGIAATTPIEAHGGRIVRSLAFSPDGRILASGGHDSTLQFLDVQTMQLLEPVTGYFLNGVTSVAFSPTPGQNLLAAGSYDNRIGLFRLQTQKPFSREACRVEGKILDQFEKAPDDILTIASTHDGLTLTRCSSSGTTPLPAPPLSAVSAAFKPGGSQFAIGDNTGSIAIYEVGTGEPVSSWGGFPGPASSLEFSPDGKILAASFCAQVVEVNNRAVCAQNEVHLLDSETGANLGSPLIAHADFITALAFNPSGNILATGSIDKTIQLWGVPNLQSIRFPMEGHTDSVTALAFSPDGRMLASGSADNRLILWVEETGNKIATLLSGSPGGISSLGFNTDGLILYSGNLDGSLLSWDLDPQKWIELICELVGNHDLTIKEWYQFIRSPYRHTCTGD